MHFFPLSCWVFKGGYRVHRSERVITAFLLSSLIIWNSGHNHHLQTPCVSKCLFLPLGLMSSAFNPLISFFMFERLCRQTSPDSMLLTFEIKFILHLWQFKMKFCNLPQHDFENPPPTLSSCGIWLSFKIANIHSGDSMVKNFNADSIPNQFNAKPNEPNVN